ncbi:Histidine kinase [Flagellimonas maritima]|uniref:Histidine kinase n=1 Tax=Flagellimonas maritima TaxID=1383885 RepID=A0A2Z4LV90_9FLAO|nr:histidine kinase [Allomuricauda aurantiaca]AWX45835.1 Histidine kinase [Allomuricauda aurantiaca]
MEPYFHGLLWCVVLFYPYMKYMGREGGYPMSFLHELNSLFFKMTISYFLYVWYFPKKKQLKYLPILLIVFVLNVLGYEYIDNYFHPQLHDFWLDFVSQSLTYIAFGFVFFTIFIIKRSYKKQLEIHQLTQEKQQAEIRALKAQVNPHFLFNTLNTIYANALRKDDKTPELILKLSDGFRYMLHEGQKEFVTIEQEIQHLKDYVHLQKERLAKKVIVNFSTNIDDETQQIAPLLCIGFVENAFKYTSILKGEGHKIDMNIKLQNKKLSFLCNNPFNDKAVEEINVDWKESGVGIKNTENRLQLLYPENHTLEVREEKQVFNVKLEMQL